jgi:pyruvate,water dikinase
VIVHRAGPSIALDLVTVDGDSLALVGGKAANLGELTAAGLPVPPGFAVTTEAYRRVVEATDLGRLCAVLATTNASDTAALADHARRARELLAAATVPPEVTEAVTAAYGALGAGSDIPVAVRSSATAEDLPTASFAGQHDTYLNVVGTQAVLDAVHRCWISLWTDRAVSYRAVNDIDHTGVELAVVVQRMVDVAVAGVLFTADPVTGRRHRAVLDASPGLGEAVVSGAVNPDRFVVDADTGEILERRLGDKRLAIRAVSGGGTEQVVRPPDALTASLSDTQVRRLVALGAAVERHYGAPQDIEWALDDQGLVWLTQARPITTLFPLPAAETFARDGAQVRVYFCASLAQGLHRPITPMGLAAFRVLGSSMAHVLGGVTVPDPVRGPAMVTEAAGRLFLDVTALIRHPVGRVVFPRVLDVMEARSAVVLRRLREDPRLATRRGGRMLFARRVARFAIHYRVPLVALQAVANPAVVHRRCARLAADLHDRAQPLRGATGNERLEAVIHLLGRGIVPIFPRVAPAAAAGFGMLALARWLLGEDAHPGDLQTVLRGLPHNVTTEMDLNLWQLAASMRTNTATATAVRDGDGADLAARYRAGTLPTVLQHGLEEFLRTYGHRAVAEIDIGMPRWREDPGYVLGVLANYLRLPEDAADPASDFRRGAAAAEAMIATLRDRARRRGRVRATAVGFSLDRTRQLAGLREMPKYLLVLGLAGARAELTTIGHQLATADRVAAPDDVFFLSLSEVRVALDGADLRDLVRRRRETYLRELRRRRLPRLLLSDGTEPEAATAPASDGALRGTPASAGVVTAAARVVLDPAGAHLEPGEILVAPSTDPGWTPLFLTAGGLVMEMGGANSHGAVVAREYGIPAVVGVPDATMRITTGQPIQVDGTNGVVSPGAA